MSEPATVLRFAPGRSTSPPRTSPELTAFNHLRLVLDPETWEDEADERAAAEAHAEWEADGYRTVPAEQVWAED